MPAREFTGTVLGGRLPPEVQRGITATLDRLEGKRVVLTVALAKKKRSTNQNAYWFGMLGKYVVPAFREHGDNWSEWTVHEYIMNELGYQEVLVDPKGKLFVSRKHSSEFSTIAWEEFMERGREFLARVHGIRLPLPNEGTPA